MLTRIALLVLSTLCVVNADSIDLLYFLRYSYHETTTNAVLIPETPYAEETRTPVGDEWKDVNSAAVLAAKHFNDHLTTYVSGVDDTLSTCAHQIKIRARDTHSLPQFALQTFLNEVSDPQPHALIGAARSACSTPVALAGGVLGVPQLSYWSTSPELNDKDRFTLFGRTIPDDATLAETAASLTNSYLGYDHLAILYVGDSYGSALKEALFAYVNALGVEAKTFEYQFGSKESIASAVASIKETKYNAVFCVTFTDDLEYLSAAVREHGMSQGKIWLFADGVSVSGMQSLSQEDQALWHGSFIIAPVGGVDTNPRFQQYLNDLPQFASDVDYINEVLGEYDQSDKFNSTLPSNFFDGKNSVYDIATYAYDAVWSFGLAFCRLPTADWSNGHIVFNELKANTSFSGLSGNVMFNPFSGTRLVDSANLRLFNFAMSDSLTSSEVGSWDGTKWIVDEANTHYSTGTSEPPPDVPQQETELNYISSASFGVSIAFASIVMTTVLALAIWIVMHKKIKVVQHSQVEFMLTILFGTLLTAVAIIFFGLDDNGRDTSVASAACMAGPWFLCLGYAISFSALFVKVHRIKKLFNNTKLKKITVTAKEMFLVIGAVVFVEIIILTIWTVVSPLEWVRKDVATDEFGQVTESMGSCTGENSAVFVALLCAINVLLLIAGNVITYQVRNVGTSFQEGKFIAICMICYLQLFLLGIPVLIVVSDSPSTQYFVLAALVFFADMCLLVAMFVPKILLVHTHMMHLEGATNTNATRAHTGSTTQRHSLQDKPNATFVSDSSQGNKPAAVNPNVHSTLNSQRSSEEINVV